MNRRTLLLTGGVMGSCALAGCTSNVDDENGTGDGTDAGDGGDPSENPEGDEQQPDERPDDSVDQPAPQTLSGSGDATESIDIVGGLTVVESQHEGSGSFRVLFEASNGAQGRYAEGTGAFEGTEADLLTAGTYTVEIVADGAWRLEVRQPRAAEDGADDLPQTLDGSGQDVIGPIAFGGSHAVTGAHDGTGWFQVRVFPETGTNPEMMILEQGEYEGEEAFEFNSVGWVAVDADGAWTLEIE